MAGQMSLFDLVGEEDKKAYEISMPDVGEYAKEVILAFEKDVLGIYLSGHPLEQYRGILEKNISAKTTDDRSTCKWFKCRDPCIDHR